MKKIKCLLALILVLASIVSLAGCYIISGQTMNKVKGTYKLTKYTYIPSHERKDGYTPRTFDYVNDEEYKYEDYLVVTGSNMGYYIHKEANGDSYIKEVTLSYEYNSENTSKVEYIIFNDSISVNSDEGGTHRLGVNKKVLNYNKNAFDFTQVITKKPMRSEDISVRWEKVDNATDLSYAKDQVGNLKFYKYQAFAARGVYELSAILNTETNEILTIPYQYYYIVIDTADGVDTATVYYMDPPAEDDAGVVSQGKKTVTFSASEDFKTVTIDGKVWNIDPQWNSYYSSVISNQESQLRLVSHDISDASINSLIENKMPTID